MSCENLAIPKPLITSCTTEMFGIPFGAAGRTVGGTDYPIAGIVLHCYSGTAAELCNEMKCRTKQSVVSNSHENSFHYGIGANSGGSLQQFVDDGCISWSFGAYKNNNYITAPPPYIPVNWPTLQGIHGVNVTPDVYTIDIALAIGHIVDATQSGCFTCPTSSGLEQSQHDILVQLLAYLAQEYNIPVTTDYITFHDLIRCDDAQECNCTDIDTLLGEVSAFCPPCEGPEAATAPVAEPNDNIQYIMGITEACCPNSNGCLELVPWNACFVGDLAQDGDLEDYVLGLAQDPITGQWCLTRGCLGVSKPIIGCGTVTDPLNIDRCCIEEWLDTFAPLSQVNRVMGTDDNGCWTLESPDSFIDRVICDNPENASSVPEWILAKTDNTCPEWVTPGQIVEEGLIVAASNCISLMFNAGVLTMDPIIAPTQGGVPNVLSCLPSGLYVPQVLPVSGNCITVVNNGDGTYTNNLVISPDANNALECRPNGAYATPFMLTEIDGNCVDLTINQGLGTITADLILSPDANNILECRPNGAYVPDIVFNDTDCINVTYAGGVVTIEPFVAGLVSGVENAITCTTSGFFVPRGANLLANSPLTGNGNNLNPLDIDFTALDAQDLCDLGGVIPAGILVDIVGTDVSGCLVSQSGIDVIDLFLVADNTDCIDLDLSSGVLTATPIIDPAIDNILSCGINGLYVPDPGSIAVSDTDCVDLDLTAGVLSGTIVFAPTQSGVPNVASCISGQGLYVPEGAGLSVFDTNCIDLNLVGGVLTANPILDPDTSNQLQCNVNGLFVPQGAGLSTVNTDCITLTLIAGVISASPVIAPAQGGNANALTCIPGQGLYVAATGTTNLVVNDTDCTDLNLVGNVLTSDPIISPLVDNILTCTPNGLYAPIAVSSPIVGDGTPASPLDVDYTLLDAQDLCDIGGVIENAPVSTASQDMFVILDEATECLTRGDRLHNLNATALPGSEGFAEGYTIGSYWNVPAGTFSPGQIRALEFIFTDHPFFPWQKISGGTQIGAGGTPPNQLVPPGINFVPVLNSVLFDVLDEVNLPTNNMISLAGGNQQTHLAAQITTPVVPAGGADFIIEMGVLVNGFTTFSPIIQRFYATSPGQTFNITGVTQIYSTAAGDNIEAYIMHNAGGNADLSSWVVNHAETTVDV